MLPYTDIHGDSGIAAYQIGRDSITIEFKHGGIYLYNHASAGRTAIAEMKRLAKSGDGLNTYLNQQVRNNYAAKFG